MYAVVTALLLFQDGVNFIIISGVFSVRSELGNKETARKREVIIFRVSLEIYSNSGDRKILTGLPRGPEPRTTVLAKTSKIYPKLKQNYFQCPRIHSVGSTSRFILEHRDKNIA